ncbi:MAG: IMP cyclohydrolase, partial [Ruthenibacterium sp.]
FEEALRTREFEPDYPNCTPRISGLLRANGDYTLSILKAEAGRCRRQFFEYPAADGMGHFLSTYQGDGTPLPSFAGEPLQVTIDETDAEALAQKLWAALNAENRVALFVRCSDRAAGLVHTRVINQYGVGDGETVPCPSGKVGTK